MRERLLIYGGLALFVALVTYPLWHGVALGTRTSGPDIKLPVAEKHCVAPRDYMRSAHMALLIQWREAAVRQGQLQYTAYDGKIYKVNLTGTCVAQCHTNKEQFCDRCHTYAGVTGTSLSTPGPYCWDCHNDVPKASPPAVAARMAP